MNLRNAKSLAMACRKANDVVCFRGLHGIGKTAIVKQHCKDNGFHYEELILSLKEPADLLGMPTTEETESGKKTVFCEPDWVQNITNKAWPVKFYFQDLEFSDKGFEEHCKKMFDITSSSNKHKISRKDLNSIYRDYYDILEDGLYLTRNQANVRCKKSQHSVLFCDEYNRAASDTRQASMQLILEKRLHHHFLPYVDGVQTQIIMAINGQPADSEVDAHFDVGELDAAQLDRVLMADVEANIEDFLDYGRSVGMNSAILDFLSEFPDRLHFMPEDGDTHATPRSWEKLAGFVDNFDNTPDAIKFNIIKGRVGKAVGMQFYSYLQNYSKTLKLEDIEKFIDDKSKETSSMEELGEQLKALCEKEKVEVIRIKELTLQLEDKYSKDGTPENLYRLLSMMYSLHAEVAMSYCKELYNRNSKIYEAIAKLDNELNNRKFFTRLNNLAK